jgi:hypothetical protein
LHSGFENEFVDIDSFSDVVAKVAKEAKTSAAAVETIDPQPVKRLLSSRKSLK